LDLVVRKVTAQATKQLSYINRMAGENLQTMLRNNFIHRELLIHLMDEAGFKCGYVRGKTITTKLLNGELNQNGHVLNHDVSRSDTAVVTVRGDGRKLPAMIIRHLPRRGPKLNPTAAKVAGMNNDLMIEYAREVLLPHLPPGAVLLMDRLSSHASPKVLRVLRQMMPYVRFGLIPTKASVPVFVSPLDNSFFSLLKWLYFHLKSYYQEMNFTYIRENPTEIECPVYSEYRSMDVQEANHRDSRRQFPFPLKKAIILLCVDSISERKVMHYFLKCKLIVRMEDDYLSDNE
jgi:hypothetical protein